MKTFDDIRFAELILYIAERCQEDPTFGAVKLNKILFYADFYAHRLLGESITGATYQKLAEGPAPRQMLPVRERLLDAQAIAIKHVPYFNGVQQRVIAKRRPNDSMFRTQELALVDEVVRFFWGMTARQVSEFSHQEIGWRVVNEGEDIPYQSTWLSHDYPGQEAEEFGRALISGAA